MSMYRVDLCIKCHLETVSINYHNIETVVGPVSVENQRMSCKVYNGPKASSERFAYERRNCIEALNLPKQNSIAWYLNIRDVELYLNSCYVFAFKYLWGFPVLRTFHVSVH